MSDLTPNTIQVPLSIWEAVNKAITTEQPIDLLQARYQILLWQQALENHKPPEPAPRLMTDPLIHVIASRDGGYHCHYCYVRLASSPDEIETGLGQPEIEHKIPRSKGGQDTLDNYVLACHNCNQYKGNRFSYESFRELTAYLRGGVR